MGARLGRPSVRYVAEPDPKPAPRIKDSQASVRKLLADPACRACGTRAINCHHLLGKGQRGDDVVENLIPLCGSGSEGCHGALHGNPYSVMLRGTVERRDAAWVRLRIGTNLRMPEWQYLVGKLGGEPACEHVRSNYITGQTVLALGETFRQDT